MGAHNDHYKMGACLGSDALIEDPGAGGTIVVDPEAGYQVCKITTATSESRTIPAPPAGIEVGSRLVVNFVTDGGTLTVEFSDTTNTIDGTNYVVTMADSGDYCEFVIRDVNGTKAWTLALNLGGSLSAP